MLFDETELELLDFLDMYMHNRHTRQRVTQQAHTKNMSCVVLRPMRENLDACLTSCVVVVVVGEGIGEDTGVV